LDQADCDLAEIVRQGPGEPFGITLSRIAGPTIGERHPEPVRVTVHVVDLGPGDPGGTETSVDPVTADRVDFEAEPNDTPESANRLVLGRTIYGLADDRPHWTPEPDPTGDARGPGIDWFRFRFDGPEPRLAYFALDFVDRDVPPDLRVYRRQDGRMVEYTRGIDPQSLQRERPPRPGANKFTTRVLEPGTYYLRMDACQPDYQLRTKLFDVPPYIRPEEAPSASPQAIAAAARKAVRTAMDFQLLAGDSWHANTPRKGHPTDRVANFHHETSTCVACHPTHFTTQSAMAAVKAGYPVEQPFALQFLVERLANNPVPFHGHPDAVWARMIPAPANVLGRLSTIVQDHEDRIAGPHRDHLHRAIAEFLRLYYDGRTAVPPDETNGNNQVSRYKVATDSWRQLDWVARRTGDDRYARTRDLVARLLPTGQPANTRDLAAQTIGLCLIDPKRQHLGGLIDSNVCRLLEFQRPNGHWSVKFDPKHPITEMQTGESLYALALAGRGPEDPAMRRGILALLTRQQPFGGWFDVNPYEQFRTPFRETQWALMALSTIFPNPRPAASGWNGPLGPQPATLRTQDPSNLIRDLERIWDEPNAVLLGQVVAQVEHPSPLVRYAACRTLSRVGSDRTAIDALVRGLGDETRVVRRAAAEALRSIGNRLNASAPPGAVETQRLLVDRLQAALRSPDDRTRRGATCIFAAHFRELSQELGLANVLLERLDDADPIVAMQAIKGLWRWWYWRADPSLRDRIEDRFIAALSRPEHPWVRRNLVEALYIIGDENIRYLDNNWIPSLARAEDRRAATDGQHATVNRLGAKYVRALEAGNTLQREGILRAMSEFFERPVLGGRIGNDLEPMLFHEPVAKQVEASLIARLSDADATIRRLSLQALVTIRDDRSADLARTVLRRLGDSDDSVRNWAATLSREFPLRVAAGKADAATLALIDELLAEAAPTARSAALGLLGRVGPAPDRDGRDLLAEKIPPFLSAPDATVRAAALEALRSFPRLSADAEVRRAVLKALGDPDSRVRVAAIILASEPSAAIREASLRQSLDEAPPSARILLLDRIGAEARLRRDLRMLGVVSTGLLSADGGVREKALQLIQKRGELIADAAIEGALRELARDGAAGQRHREVARSLLASRGRSSGGDGTGDRLDLAYFRARILPIFNRMGEDGQNCMGCHRSHTILRMVPSDKDGDWSPDAVRDNYRSALRVVNLAKPSESLLLGKPTWEAAEEAEAQNDPTRKAHAGGVRFETGSREYQTLLDWLNGARLPAGDQSAAR
jgi:HEAT repeat protein